MSAKQSDEIIDFATANDRILADLPEISKAWDRAQPALEVVLMLVRCRKSKGLTQAELAIRAGWDKSFVSRLERPNDQIPGLATITRYLEACDARAGLVVASTDTQAQLHVDDAISLSGGEAGQHLFEDFRDRDFDWDVGSVGAGR
jgi:transcriptional regulator with XRE-family HTH domain